MSGEDRYTPALLDIEVESEQEADAALVASLHLELRRAFDRQDGCWKGRDTHDTLRLTCHAAEVMYRLSLDAESAKMVREAGTWLINLRLPDHLDGYDRDRTRLYPSRFKTLAYLGRFDDAIVRRDFAALLNREIGGMVRGVTESDVLTTCIVLDTLLTLEQAGIRQEVCGDRRYEAIISALKRQLKAWRPQAEQPTPRRTDAGSPAAPVERAQRGSGPLSEIGDARELSYIYGLLAQLGRLDLPIKRAAALVGELARVIEDRSRGRGVDSTQALYAALQLTEHCRDDARIQAALHEARRGLRLSYASEDGTNRWPFAQQALVMRLVIAHYGEAALAKSIASCFLRETERRHAERRGTFETELRQVIRERVEIAFGAIQQLSGGYTGDQIFRVPFTYWYPAPGHDGEQQRRPLDGTHQASVIIKRSVSDAFHTATENYSQLPPALKAFFVRQPAASQVYKSELSSSYYLAMEDLAEYLPFEEVFGRFDQREMSDEHGRLLRSAIERICSACFALFRETAVPRSALAGTHVARLYLSPIEAKLVRAVRRVPWLKNPLQGYSVGEQRFRGIDHYLAIISQRAQALQPRALGLTHGDLHARNIMVDSACTQVKLIDLDKLSKEGDYLADLGNLLTDVCVYRRVAQPDADYGLRRGDIHFITKGGEGTAENAVSYPALGRPATLALQRHALEAVAAFADEQADAMWRPRLWLASASALLVRLSFEKQKETAAVLYGEAIRLLHELCRYLEDKGSLPSVLVPDTWPEPAAARTPTTELPDWIHRSQTLRRVHEGLRRAGLHATPDRATVSYFAAEGQATPLAKLVPPGREGIGRLLLPTDALDGASLSTAKLVSSGKAGDAFSTICIILEVTDADEVVRLVQAHVEAPVPQRGK
ncbi:MAG TPA: phosphotransferase [Ktedonobacterales bacterium]|nr:phosphotransferase [Ktedonobacterales bacterium]